MNEPPYHIDIDGLADDTSSGAATPATSARPWVGIHFECCEVYTRIYRNKEGNAYQGCCPRCTRRVTLRVGTGGTDSRFFRAE